MKQQGHIRTDSGLWLPCEIEFSTVPPPHNKDVPTPSEWSTWMQRLRSFNASLEGELHAWNWREDAATAENVVDGTATVIDETVKALPPGKSEGKQ